MNNTTESLDNHFTVTQHTHYTIQFKDKNYTWLHKWTNGGVKYFGNLEAATKEMEDVLKDYKVEEATIIEWKKTPVLVKKNIKPIIKSKTTFDVEMFNRKDSNWCTVYQGFEALELAQKYINSWTSNALYSDNYRIIQRDVTVKTSIV